MVLITPGDAVTQSPIVIGEMQDTDSKLIDNNDGYVVDSLGNYIFLNGGIIPDDPPVSTTLIPSEAVVTTYNADDTVINTSVNPAEEISTTYTGADDPTTVTWG